MKIKYQFVNETVEIEVDEEWASVVIELDRLEHNSNQTETRRHCSLDALNLDDAYLPSDTDVEEEVLAGIESAWLHDAIAKLLPSQQELVKRVYFKGEKIIRIAEEEGVTEAAIRDRLKKINKKLKKNLR